MSHSETCRRANVTRHQVSCFLQAMTCLPEMRFFAPHIRSLHSVRPLVRAAKSFVASAAISVAPLAFTSNATKHHKEPKEYASEVL